MMAAASSFAFVCSAPVPEVLLFYTQSAPSIHDSEVENWWRLLPDRRRLSAPFRELCRAGCRVPWSDKLRFLWSRLGLCCLEGTMRVATARECCVGERKITSEVGGCTAHPRKRTRRFGLECGPRILVWIHLSTPVLRLLSWYRYL